MTDVTWLQSASALLLGHLCAHVVHVDAYTAVLDTIELDVHKRLYVMKWGAGV